MTERDFTKEFEFITSRSSGAGGQNVNKVSTKVELRFHVDSSEILTPEEKIIIKEKLEKRINKDGYLQVVSQETRSQLKNKEICIDKFYELINKAFEKPKFRKATKPTLSSIKKRLSTKKILSNKKSDRKPRIDMGD